MNTRYKPLLLLTAVFLLTACDFIATYSRGTWANYDRPTFNVSITDHAINVQDGQKHHHLGGNWSNNCFYVNGGFFGAGDVAACATDDQTLVVYMKYFDPNDTSVVSCIKTHRGYNEPSAYPQATDMASFKVPYPPPKGLIRVGMLEADLQRLPWVSPTVDMDGQGGTDYVEIYTFRSDDPKLPELKVRCVNGKVTEVLGGAEDQPGPSWWDTHPSKP